MDRKEYLRQYRIDHKDAINGRQRERRSAQRIAKHLETTPDIVEATIDLIPEVTLEQAHKSFCDTVIAKHCGACPDGTMCTALLEYKDIDTFESDTIPCLVCDLMDYPRGSTYGVISPNLIRK